MTIPRNLNIREISTILHGLRMIQENANGHGDCMAACCDHFDEAAELNDVEVDNLCEFLTIDILEDEPVLPTVDTENQVSSPTQPITLRCGACVARPGQPCELGVIGDRVGGFHTVRIDKARELDTPHPHQSLLQRVQEAQRKYWDLLGDLEEALGFTVDVDNDLEGTTIERLMEKNQERLQDHEANR